jgi:hypothetical protein
MLTLAQLISIGLIVAGVAGMMHLKGRPAAPTSSKKRARAKAR